MTKLTFTAAALIAISALAAVPAAKADNLQGGPTAQNGQCFKYSVGNEKDARFGSWNACAQKASAAIPAPTQQQRRRHRSASR